MSWRAGVLLTLCRDTQFQQRTSAQPKYLGLFELLTQSTLWADYSVECIPDLARGGSAPTRADLAHIDQLLPLLFAEIESGNTGWISYEADDGESALLNGFDFLPGFSPL